MVILVLLQSAELSEASMEFDKQKRSSYHTFNRSRKNYYHFIRWKSQRMLPVRFSAQFTLNKDTPIKYFEVVLTNLTNAVLLIES